MNRLIRIGCNGLIIVYLGIIYFSGVPESNTLNFRLKQKAQAIAFGIGIWPSWSMFAPNPIKFDSKSFVEVTYADGEIKEYDVEIDLDGPFALFRKARWMKYAQDNLRSEHQRGLLGPAMRHFKARYDTPERPVAKVVIKRKWWDVKPLMQNRPLPHIQHSRQEHRKTEILISKSFGN